MFRVVADVNLEDGSMRRARYDPYESESDSHFLAKYRFSKPEFLELQDIIGPALERRSSR